MSCRYVACYEGTGGRQCCKRTLGIGVSTTLLEDNYYFGLFNRGNMVIFNSPSFSLPSLWGTEYHITSNSYSFNFKVYGLYRRMITNKWFWQLRPSVDVYYGAYNHYRITTEAGGLLVSDGSNALRIFNLTCPVPYR